MPLPGYLERKDNIMNEVDESDKQDEPVFLKPCNSWTTILFFYKLSVPTVKECARLGIHPNFVTVTGMLFTLLNIALLLLAPAWILTPLFSAFIFTTYWLLDHVDGELARLTGKTSKTGAFLDMIGDKAGKVGTLLAFCMGPLRHQGMMIPALVLVVLHYGSHWFVNYHLGQIYSMESFFQTDRKYLGFFTSFEECLLMLVVAPLFYNAHAILALWTLAIALFLVDALVFPGGSNLPDTEQPREDKQASGESEE